LNVPKKNIATPMQNAAIEDMTSAVKDRRLIFFGIVPPLGTTHQRYSKGLSISHSTSCAVRFGLSEREP
jgi:hypothetical protein